MVAASFSRDAGSHLSKVFPPFWKTPIPMTPQPARPASSPVTHGQNGASCMCGKDFWTLNHIQETRIPTNSGSQGFKESYPPLNIRECKWGVIRDVRKKKEPGNLETPPQRLKKLRILDMTLARNYCSGRQLRTWERFSTISNKNEISLW